MRRPLVLAALLLALAPAGAAAQPRSRVAGADDTEARRSNRATSLRGALGVPVARRLLHSDDSTSRIRGIQRLGAIGTDEAIGALVETLEGGSAIDRDPRAKLEAMRVLARETKRENARLLLAREVTDLSSADSRGSAAPQGLAIRAAAAFALAASGDKKSLATLITALGQPGLAADAAARALRVYPPASLESFLEGRKRLTPGLATFLGELGDLRALDRLRAMLAEGEPGARTAAAVALAKLGDAAALVPAREWLKKGEPKLRRAATEVLVHLSAPEAIAAIVALLESDSTRDDGVRLALLAPDPALAAPLLKALPDVGVANRGRVIAAIGRAGGIAELISLLDRPELATNAAFAIATMPGRAARAALEQALGSDKGQHGELRRVLLRAGTARALALDDPPHGLGAALEAALEAQAPAERALAAFGLVASRSMSLDRVLKRFCPSAETPMTPCNLTVVAGAARGALALPDGASSLQPLLPLLARAASLADPRRSQGPRRADDETLADAAGISLLARPDGGDLPTAVLASWAETGGPLAPLAARALGSRDDDALRGRLKSLLEGTDPVIRAHVALGLGRDPEPSAVSLLTSAYRFEEDPSVRRAIVRGLSQRRETQREATLSLARDLDADDEVRALARAALQGRDLGPGVASRSAVEPRRSLAWVNLAPNAIHESDSGRRRAARLVRSDGLAVPVVADPDGVLLVPGLPPGPAALLLGPEGR